jgi:hypothetical protein
MRFAAIILGVLCLGLAQASAQQDVPPASGTAIAQKAAHDDLEDLRADLQQMKVLVRQMESNLAFVDTTQSPLKHQFQLEIDMWKTVIQQMERRLDHAAPH